MPALAPPAVVTLRPAGPADDAFLADLFTDVRAAELAVLGGLLAMQHDLRERSYRAAYPGADDAIVLVDDRRAGRLLVDRGDDVLHVIDLALVAAERGRGVGTALLRDLLAEAAATGRRVRLVVRRENPARRLYERIGLRVVDDSGLDLLMESS